MALNARDSGTTGDGRERGGLQARLAPRDDLRRARPDETLIETVLASGSTARVVQGVIATGVVVLALGLLWAVGKRIVVPWAWVWLIQGAVALGALVGARIAARRPRSVARQLPDPEALRILAPLARSEDELLGRIAVEAMRGLRPEGTEVLPATPAEGTGREVAPEPMDGAASPAPPAGPDRPGPASC